LQHLQRLVFLVLVAAILMLTACSSEDIQATQTTSSTVETTEASSSSIESPYQGQETRKIKALSQDDIDGLLNGSGTPFGGLAKPAELNGYPGPRHVLDAVESGEFQVTSEQLVQIESLYEEMRSNAIKLGKAIIEAEEAIDTGFSSSAVTENSLQQNIAASVELYGQLRVVHLNTHLSMIDILHPEQVIQYNILRGYSSGGDPCTNVPTGDHDAAMWQQHNNCP